MPRDNSQLERELQRDITRRLDALQRQGAKIFYFKTHGSNYQKAGLPDILGSFWGIFTGIELKRPSESAKLSGVQANVCIQINKAQGKYYIVWDIDSFNEAIKDVYNYSQERCGGSASCT